MNGKVAAVMEASPGMTGTARGQSQLRQAFVFTNTYALLQPEFLVGHTHEKLDAYGRVVHQARDSLHDVSAAVYRTDRASRYGRGKDHNMTPEPWPTLSRAVCSEPMQSSHFSALDGRTSTQSTPSTRS